MTKENIKNYITETINDKKNVIISFSDFEISFPDKITLTDIIITLKDSKSSIGKIKTIRININTSFFLKNFILKPDEIFAEGAEINLWKKDNIWNIEKIFSEKEKNKYELPDIKLLNSIIKLENKDNKYKSFIEIKDFKLTKKLFSKTFLCNIDMNYQSDSIRNIGIKSDFSFDKTNRIEINKLETTIKNKRIEITGEFKNIPELSSRLILKTSEKINLKDFLKINKDIFFDRFDASIDSNLLSNNVLNLKSYIKELNVFVTMDIDIKSGKIISAEIKTKGTDIKKVSNFVNPYIKNFSGKVDMDIIIREKDGAGKLYLIAQSSGLNFSDTNNLLNFKNTNLKLMITPSWTALNIIKTIAEFPQGKASGSLKSDSDGKNEKIEIFFTLDDIKAKSSIFIKNINSPKRSFNIKINTTKFDFDRFYEIFNYFDNKLSKIPVNYNSKYSLINRKAVILWDSENLIKTDLIKASKIIIKCDIDRFGRLNRSIGNIKIKILNGIMDNIQKNTEKNERYQLIFLPIIKIFSLNRIGALMLDSTLNSINFSDMGADFNLNNGKIIVNKFYLNSKEFLIYAKGNLDMNNQLVNLEVYIINRKDYKSGALPESLTDSKGRPALAFSVKGSFNKNEVKIFDATNITELVEKQVQSSLNIN
ncbi:MAG: hypothetical protein K6357_03245 [Elusimicrobiota bacterium]